MRNCHLRQGKGERRSIEGCRRHHQTKASSAEGHSFCGELDAGVAMDRGDRDKISRVENTNSGFIICH